MKMCVYNGGKQKRYKNIQFLPFKSDKNLRLKTKGVLQKFVILSVETKIISQNICASIG